MTDELSPQRALQIGQFIIWASASCSVFEIVTQDRVPRLLRLLSAKLRKRKTAPKMHFPRAQTEEGQKEASNWKDIFEEKLNFFVSFLSAAVGILFQEKGRTFHSDNEAEWRRKMICHCKIREWSEMAILGGKWSFILAARDSLSRVVKWWLSRNSDLVLSLNQSAFCTLYKRTMAESKMIIQI